MPETTKSTMPSCLLCEREVDTLDHPAAPCETGGAVEYACGSCYDRLIEATELYRRKESSRCDGCGALAGTGCSCPANAKAIHRGEQRKQREEEPWRS